MRFLRISARGRAADRARVMACKRWTGRVRRPRCVWMAEAARGVRPLLHDFRWARWGRNDPR